MVQTSLAEMFSSLGWGSGFKLPVSNAINAQLEQELEKKQKRALQLSSELEECDHYIGLLGNQIERAKEQLELEQKVIAAKRSEIDTESSLTGIAIRTYSKTQADKKKDQKLTTEIRSRKDAVDASLAKRKGAIADLAAIVHFDRSAMESYQKSIEEKENYISFIEQFAEMDKKALGECRKKYDVLATANANANNELLASNQRTLAYQTQLDQNTSLLRRHNKERVEALNLWKATLNSMKARDVEMSEIAKEYVAAKNAALIVEKKAKSKKQMLESEQRSKAEKIRARTDDDRKYDSLKQTLYDTTEHCSHISEITSKIQADIKTMSQQIQASRKKLASIEEEIRNGEKAQEAVGKEVSLLRERYDLVMGASMTSEERMKEVESLLDSEANKIETLIGRLEKERNFVWLRCAQKTDLRDKIEQMEYGIRTRKSRILATKEEIQKQESLIQRNKILLYEEELVAFQLANRCEKLLNPVANMHTEEIKEMQGRIAHLKSGNDKLNSQKNYLSQEVKHIVDTVQEVMKQMRLSAQDHAFLKGHILQRRLETEKCDLDYKGTKKNLRDQTVDYRLIQVQLKRMHDLGKAQQNALFDLEHERTLMNSVAKEKKAEMDIHTSLLVGKKRMLQDDRSKLRIEIAELQSALEKLKKKYEILMHTLESTPGDNEIHSEAYYIIKQAEESELLRQEGDMWDARVKEAEQEIIAIQNTLSLIYNSNNSFKESLAPMMENAPEAAITKRMQDSSSIALVTIKQSQNARRSLAKEINLLTEQLQKATEDKTQYNLECYDRKYELSAMLLDLENQNTKIRRANVMSNKILRELGPQGEHERHFIELDMKYLHTKTKLEYALSTLERFVSMYPSVKAVVVEYLHLKDMKKAAARIMNSGRSGASSVASTPNRSGRSTPVTGKGRRQPKSAATTSNVSVRKGESQDYEKLLESDRALKDVLGELPIMEEEDLAELQGEDDFYKEIPDANNIGGKDEEVPVREASEGSVNGSGPVVPFKTDFTNEEGLDE